MRKFALLIGLVLVVAACSPDTESIDGSWVLVSGKVQGEEIPVHDDHPITLDINTNHISGVAACNEYGGDALIEDGSFETSGVFQTEKACFPEETMDTERTYLDGLRLVESYALEGDQLTLTGPDVDLVFEPTGDATAAPSGNQTDTELWAEHMFGAWQLASGMANGEPIPIVDTHPITLTIDEKGVGGTAACNHYGLDPSGGFSVTEMACFPPETMESEAAFLDALSKVDEGVAEDGLLLVGDGVELRFIALDPVPTADLLGTVWVLESLVQQETVSSVGGERATLELFSDGSFIGSTGCRTLSGTYVVTGAEVQFTNFGAEGECPANLQSQDSLVITVLEGGFRVEIDGDQLTLWTRGDEALIFRANS